MRAWPGKADFPLARKMVGLAKRVPSAVMAAPSAIVRIVTPRSIATPRANACWLSNVSSRWRERPMPGCGRLAWAYAVPAKRRSFVILCPAKTDGGRPSRSRAVTLCHERNPPQIASPVFLLFFKDEGLCADARQINCCCAPCNCPADNDRLIGHWPTVLPLCIRSTQRRHGK